MKNQESVNDYLKQAIVENWNREALTNLDADTYLYRDVARKITKLHILFESAGVAAGDKIALCGGNSAEWTIAFLAVLTYGAVAVPVMADFTVETLHHLVNHSDSKILFVDRTVWKKMDERSMPELKAAVCIQDYSVLFTPSKDFEQARLHLNELFGKKFPERFTVADFTVATRGDDDTVLINYTAGSTGFSKGVMISEKSLWSNLQYCIDHLEFLHPGDNMLSLLPLAHMYGLVIEMLHPVVKGCHVFLLGKTPTPKILLDAFKTVRPKLIIAVPLVLEKIIRSKVFPLLRKPAMKIMLKTPGLRHKVLTKIKENLMNAFGGNLIEMIIGGAALAKDVEEFLMIIGFPVTVGYGMTECAPLISYCPHETRVATSCGKVVDRMEINIESADPTNIPGVLWVKGDNIMQGYYKNPEATQAVMRDGWMNTGDVCQIDAHGNIFIRGRDKNMILGPSGQNIYPEEIEAVIADNPLVAECIVIDIKGKIVALVYPDAEFAKQNDIAPDRLLDALKNVIEQTNKRLPAYSQIADVRIQEKEFEKTPKRSIKRYLYQNA